jgi:hypothetical protein
MDSWFEMYHINNNNCFSGGNCSLPPYIKAKSNGNSPVGLALKMEYFVQELMNDNGTILYFIKRKVDLSIILLNCIQKRHVCHVKIKTRFV